MTAKKIGIITKIDPNHGSCLFDRSIYESIKQGNKEWEVEVAGNPLCRTRLLELLRAVKPSKGIPLYNLTRHIHLSRYSHSTLNRHDLITFPAYQITTREICKRQYSALIMSKVLWDITNDKSFPTFPNTYWPSREISAVKIAYGISGHRTDLSLLRSIKDRIRQNLEDYQLIGVRDDMTQAMMAETGVDKIVPVERISDPAFLCTSVEIDLPALLARFGISSEKPVLGMLFYGKPQLAQAIADHYHLKGYQLLNFNMFNPYADINIGHLVDPDEWAALFSILSFCITDRFHGSVYCIRESVPFVSIEPVKPKTLLNSKIFSLLKEFDLTDQSYFDPFQADFSISEFLSNCDDLEINWGRDLRESLQNTLEVSNKVHLDFVNRMLNLLD
jgi:hypothetical protein